MSATSWSSGWRPAVTVGAAVVTCAATVVGLFTGLLPLTLLGGAATSGIGAFYRHDKSRRAGIEAGVAEAVEDYADELRVALAELGVPAIVETREHICIYPADEDGAERLGPALMWHSGLDTWFAFEYPEWTGVEVEVPDDYQPDDIADYFAYLQGDRAHV